MQFVFKFQFNCDDDDDDDDSFIYIVKIKLSLWLLTRHTKKAYGALKVLAHVLTSEPNVGGQLHAPAALSPKE
jgi:hypothetical protein